MKASPRSSIKRPAQVQRRHEGHGGISADWPVDGRLAHITGQGPNGFRVVDVSESEEAVRRFGDMLIPVLQEIGVQTEPEMYPVHTFVSA